MKHYQPYENAPVDEPTIFLAGPIQGSSNWQFEAVETINKREVSVANPNWDSKGKFHFKKQIEWESRHLHQAAFKGCILFWLETEQTHYCERAYAQTSRFELAEWATKTLMSDDVRIVVGLDNDFSGRGYIRYRLENNFPNIIVVDSLARACDMAVGQVQGR